MTNMVSSFPATNHPMPLHRHGGTLEVTSELQLGFSGDDYDLQGTGNIRSMPAYHRGTSFGITVSKGTPTFINSPNLICPNGVDYVAAVGDHVIARTDGDGVWRLFVTRASGKPVVMPTITDIAPASIAAFLGADVTMTNTSLFFDGPSVAQGTSGTWFASGAVTISNSAVASFAIKLWDGATVIASAVTSVNLAGTLQVVSLSGIISSPAGNIRISCRDINDTTGKMVFNASGGSKDSGVTVVRIQ